MAKLIPSGVVNLPNFAELQYNLNRQRQADELAIAKDVAQFKQRDGIIAPGAMPLVQAEFDAWQEAAKKYAGDPSASNYAALNGSYDKYSKAHGAGRFLFETVKERDAKFYNEPTKWGISVDQYAQDSDNLIKTRYNSFDELLAAASGISDLRPATQLKPESPEAFAQEAVDAVDPMDFLNTNGTFNEQLARKRYKDIYSAKTAVEDRKRNNLIYTAANKGLIGTKTADGFKLDNLGEIDLLFSSPNFDVEGMLQEYGDQGEEIYMSLLKRNADEAYKRGIKRQELGMEYQKLRKDTDIPNDYRNLKPIDTPPSVGPGIVYRIDNAPIRTSDGTKIVGFGVVNGKELVQVTGEEDPFSVVPQGPQWRVATTSDKANLEKETQGAYSDYIRQGVSLPESSGQPQRTKSNNPLGLDL